MLFWSMQAEERIERAKCGQFRSEIGRGGIQRWDGARTFVEPDSAWCRLLLALGSVLQQLRVLGSAIVAAPNEIEQRGASGARNVSDGSQFDGAHLQLCDMKAVTSPRVALSAFWASCGLGRLSRSSSSVRDTTGSARKWLLATESAEACCRYYSADRDRKHA